MKSCRKVRITKVNDEIIEMWCSGFDMTEKEFILYDVRNFNGTKTEYRIPCSVIKLFVYFL